MYHILKSELSALNPIFVINDITHIMPEKNALGVIDIRSYHNRRICKIKEFYQNMHIFS